MQVRKGVSNSLGKCGIDCALHSLLAHLHNSLFYSHCFIHFADFHDSNAVFSLLKTSVLSRLWSKCIYFTCSKEKGWSCRSQSSEIVVLQSLAVVYKCMIHTLGSIMPFDSVQRTLMLEFDIMRYTHLIGV